MAGGAATVPHRSRQWTARVPDSRCQSLSSRRTTRNATIVTPFQGASASRVEALVSKKIEDRLRELSEIKTIESTSRSGISVVSIELQDWVTAADNEKVFSKVRDRLDDAAAELPVGAGTPEFDDKRGAVAFSMILALSWDAQSEPALGLLNRQAQRLGDRLRQVPGTEQVRFFGAPGEEIQIDVDPVELAALGISAGDLVRRSAWRMRAARQARCVAASAIWHWNCGVRSTPLHDWPLYLWPATAGAGSVITGRHRHHRQASGRILQSSLRYTPVNAAFWWHCARRKTSASIIGPSVRVRVVAEFRIGLDPAVGLQTGVRPEPIHRTTPGRSGGQPARRCGRDRRRGVVDDGLAAGADRRRGAATVGRCAVFGLTFFGEQIHQMSIFGMIIAIGLLIDNAIVMTDDVSRTRRRTVRRRQAAVSGAIRHLFAPLFASTFTTILGFMPVFLLPGNVGDFVGPIAIAVVLALIASFALSMTVIPALAGLLAADRAT